MTLTNSKLQRRQFLRTALATAGGVAALPALNGLGSIVTNGRVYAAQGKGGYGPLVPTADLRDGGVRIALPEGFQYRSFSVAGDDDVGRQSRAARARRHGRVQHATASSVWCAITRIATPPAPAPSPSTPMPTTRKGGGHDDARRQSVHARARARLHQPERHDGELRRRHHAVGILDHLAKRRTSDRRRPAGRSSTATTSTCRRRPTAPCRPWR